MIQDNLENLKIAASFRALSKGLLGKQRDTRLSPKGQLISKGLFAILEFFQKTNKTIRS